MNAAWKKRRTETLAALLHKNVPKGVSQVVRAFPAAGSLGTTQPPAKFFGVAFAICLIFATAVFSAPAAKLTTLPLRNFAGNIGEESA